MKSNPQTFEELYKYGTRISVKKGHFIYDSESGNAEQFAFLLDSGVCALSGLTADGEEQIFLYFKGQRTVGFAQLMPASEQMTRRNHCFSIIAKTDCILYQITVEVFHDLLEHDPFFSKLMLKILSENYMDILTRYRQNLEDSTSVRLCRLLLEFSGKQGQMLVLPSFFTYAELARYLGTHPVTIARIMGRLKEEGCISKHGKSTIILDPEKIAGIIECRTAIEY